MKASGVACSQEEPVSCRTVKAAAAAPIAGPEVRWRRETLPCLRCWWCVAWRRGDCWCRCCRRVGLRGRCEESRLKRNERARAVAARVLLGILSLRVGVVGLIIVAQGLSRYFPQAVPAIVERRNEEIDSIQTLLRLP